MREGQRWLSLHTERMAEVPICSETSSVFLHCSLHNWHRTTPRHQIFSVSLHFSIFESLVPGHFKLLYSGQYGARLQLTATRHLVAVSCGLLLFACLCWLYNIPNAHANSCGYTPSLRPTSRHASFSHATPAIYTALLLENTCNLLL